MTAKFVKRGAAGAIAVAFLVPVAGAAQANCERHKVSAATASAWAMRVREMRSQTGWHGYRKSVRWRMTKHGVVLCGERLAIKSHERYRLELVTEAWRRFGPLIRAASRHYRVPAELIMAVMINESGLKPKAHQKYSGYVSDDKTPHRISVGLGATLISTARYLLRDDAVDRDWLGDPSNSIRMIGLYLDRHYRLSGFDPVRVAAAYNAGGIYADDSKGNRWRMRNYPLGHGIYIDHFVLVTNKAMQFLATRDDRPVESYASIFHGPPKVQVAAKIPTSWMRKSGGLVMYRAPKGDKLGVASSSIIDHKRRSGSSLRHTVCIPFLSDCDGRSSGRQPLFKVPQ